MSKGNSDFVKSKIELPRYADTLCNIALELLTPNINMSLPLIMVNPCMNYLELTLLNVKKSLSYDANIVQTIVFLYDLLIQESIWVFLWS